MSEILSSIIGLIGGIVTFYVTNGWIEKKRENIAEKRTQLKKVFGPLEVLLKINRREFERYFGEATTDDDRQFIERQVWFPNNTEIKRILLDESHVLSEFPVQFEELMSHITVWLSEYDQIYMQGKKKPPVFAGPRGYEYPKKTDPYVYARAAELRKAVNR